MTHGYTLQWRWLALLTLGFLGTGAELVLLEHYEGVWQKVPLALLALGLLSVALCAFNRRRGCIRFLQCVMLLTLVGGLAGLYFHFQGNLEFELEMHPDERGWPLIWNTLKGATPALAPGMMILLGLLGLGAAQRKHSD